MIRRRLQLQKSAIRTIEFNPTVEGVGRVIADPLVNAWRIYSPTGALLASGAFTIDNAAGTYSRIVTSDITISYALGESYRIVFDWRQTGTTKTRTHTIYFDVISQEWSSECDLTSLESLVSSIRYRLDRQRQQLTVPITTVEGMAARYISDAQDYFFVLLASKTRETNRPALVTLVPDNQRFDTVVARLAVAFVFRNDVSAPGDSNDYMFKMWREDALVHFDAMTLIEYDATDDAIADTELRGEYREEALHEQFSR